MIIRSFLLLVAMICFSGASLGAESVFLRNGGVVTGKIIYQNKSIIRLKNKDGSFEYKKSSIIRIVYEEKNDFDSSPVIRKNSDAALNGNEKKNENFQEKKISSDIVPGKTRDTNFLIENIVVGAEDRSKNSEKKYLEEENNKNEVKNGKLNKQNIKKKVNDKNTEASKNEFQQNDITPGGILFRSMVFPGWGQIREGRTNTGLIYASGFLLAAGETAALYRKYITISNAHSSAVSAASLSSPNLFPIFNAYAKLPISTSDTGLLSLYTFASLQSLRSQKVSAARKTNSALGIACGFYLTSAADAGFQYFLKGKKNSSKDRISFFFAPGYGTASMTLHY